jgi:hypothetical protein
MGALFDIIVHFCSEHSYYILFLYLVSFFLFNDAKSNGSIYMARQITDNNRMLVSVVERHVQRRFGE